MTWRMQDYECPKCGHREERLVDTSERDTQVCGHSIYPMTREVPASEITAQSLLASDYVARAGEEPTGRRVRGKRNCQGVLTPLIGAVLPKTIVRGNQDYNERERERLEKRSWDHWQKEGRDEAVDRERAQNKKYGA